MQGIYLILDAALMPDLIETMQVALQGGIRIFQYRDKSGCRAEILIALYELAQSHQAVLTVNDDASLAHLADGIHVGQDDLAATPLAVLRSRFPDKIIGVSAHTVEQAQAASEADYLGVGPLRETGSKVVERPALSLEGIAKIAHATTLPVCAIGGITASDIPQLLEQRIAMAAVIGYIAKAPDQYVAARTLIAAWNARVSAP